MKKNDSQKCKKIGGLRANTLINYLKIFSFVTFGGKSSLVYFGAIFSEVNTQLVLWINYLNNYIFLKKNAFFNTTRNTLNPF